MSTDRASEYKGKGDDIEHCEVSAYIHLSEGLVSIPHGWHTLDLGPKYNVSPLLPLFSLKVTPRMYQYISSLDSNF